MPLPLPNLDTRRWRDLVDEGRALIPRYAPAWTDHNIHDPGIMLVELLAWLVEGLIYRANRIPERSRRKFLQLIGYPPNPPQPATTILSCAITPGTGSLLIPKGVVFLATDAAGTSLPFTTTTDTTLMEAALVAMQSFDGAAFTDLTRRLRDTLAFAAFGSSPDSSRAPALYFGFDAALRIDTPVSLYIALDDSESGERQDIIDEATAAAAACMPRTWSCPPDPAHGPTAVPAIVALPPHHSVKLAWEYLAADGWHTLSSDAGEIVDQTRSLTLDGSVIVRVPAAMSAQQIGAVTDARYWLRCRMISGQYDSAPELSAVLHNAVLVEQSLPTYASFTVAAGVVAAGTLTPGTVQSLSLTLDTDGVVGSLIVLAATDPAAANAPSALVLSFTPATAATQGELVVAFERVFSGTGFPDQEGVLSASSVARALADVWTVEGHDSRLWTLRPDFDASTWTDATVVLDADTGDLRFGNGLRGRVPPADASILAAYSSTAADGGNIAANIAWTLADTPINTALLGSTATVAASLSAIVNPLAASDGAASESIDDAADRAAEALWAHERLVQLCEAFVSDTLDQIDADTVLALPAPERATTTVDYERIARSVPGTRVHRARAWAEVDPVLPCIRASGTVTVVIIPDLPVGRPMPSAGLLRAVSRYLDRRRTLCTRLLVVGPQYITISVIASVQAAAGADLSRVTTDVRSALGTFFDPLVGGPAGRGWPFGREVFRSEVLALVDSVDGVDHVTSLSLASDSCEPTCDNICIPTTWLVASGTHSIQVTPP